MIFLQKRLLIIIITGTFLTLAGCAGHSKNKINNNRHFIVTEGNGQTSALRLMTINMSQRLRYLDEYEYHSIIDQNMVAVSDAIKSFDPDIISLQGVSNYSIVESLAEQHNFNFVYVSHLPRINKFAILSKHFISDVKNEAFLSYKKGMVSTIELNGSKFIFINVHFGRVSYKSQAKTIIQVVESLSNPIVLMGVFYIKDGDRVMEPIQAKFIDTSTTKDTNSTIFAANKRVPHDSGRIDYIFVDPSIFRVKDSGLIPFKSWNVSDVVVYYAIVELMQK